MNKYDFGYELIPDTTIAWAYKKITEHSVVLELGPANGNLVKHLSMEKQCLVDIIEIDEEAGKQAQKFARKGCIGEEEGNLDNFRWFHKLKTEKYDYIVILDVLEHLRNPEKVLKKLRELLKDHGEILLSVPNVAHNSVILELLQNRFRYTDVGLLDSTHLKFFTYTSFKDMAHAAGFIVAEEEIRYSQVGTNEIETFYEDVPRDVQAFLKTRQMGEAYQFLLTLQCGTEEKKSLLLQDQYDQKQYVFHVFNDNKQLIFEKRINPLQVLDVQIPVKNYETVKTLRIDPLDKSCIISDIRITGNRDGSESICDISKCTGIDTEGKLVFFDDDPQIYIDVNGRYSSVRFQCRFQAFDSEVPLKIAEFRDYIRSVRIQCESQNADIEQCREEIRRQQEHIDSQQGQLKEYEEAVQILQSDLKQNQEEIERKQEHLNQQEKAMSEVQLELADVKARLEETTRDLVSKYEELGRIRQHFVYRFWMKVRRIKKAMGGLLWRK